MALGRGLGDLLKQNVEGARRDVSPQELSDEGLKLVAPTEIAASPLQPRKDFDDASLSSLRASIRREGVLQPVLVRRTAKGYELIAGERRWRSAIAEGLPTIPARVFTVDDAALMRLALIENLQREDLNPIEKALAFQGLRDRFHLTQEQIAEQVGLDRATVANLVRLLELPAEIQQLVRAGKMSMGHARALVTVEPAARRLALARRAVEEGWSVRAVEEAASEVVDGKLTGIRRPRTARAVAHRDLEDRLREKFGVRTRVMPSRKGGGKVVLHFASADELARLADKLLR